MLRNVMGNHIKDEGRALVNDPEKVTPVAAGISLCAASCAVLCLWYFVCMLPACVWQLWGAALWLLWWPPC